MSNPTRCGEKLQSEKSPRLQKAWRVNADNRQPQAPPHVLIAESRLGRYIYIRSGQPCQAERKRAMNTSRAKLWAKNTRLEFARARVSDTRLTQMRECGRQWIKKNRETGSQDRLPTRGKSGSGVLRPSTA